jgi:hypothetical protein
MAAEKRLSFVSVEKILANARRLNRWPTWRALGQVVLVYFAIGGAAVTAQDTQPGRATFEFRPQRLCAFEVRRWEAQLGPLARIRMLALAVSYN